MKKIVIIVCIAIFVFLVIKSDKPEKQINTWPDKHMPRQRGFVGMEIGDIEYLHLAGQMK